MSITARLWREASLAADSESFLARIGTAILDDVDGDALVVRAIEPEQHHLVTTASVRRGAVGVAHPARPRIELSAAALARVSAWIESGAIEHVSAERLAGVARDVLRGMGDSEQAWWLVPLVASSSALGVLLVAASDELEPRKLAAIAEPLSAVLAAERQRRELSQLREAAEADKAAALARLHMRDIGVAVVGADAGLREVMRQVEQVAPTGAPVLILGETGSGKEVVARSIHERSNRAAGPILRVNCGAIPPELVDSELFGHERGSFTGAATQRRGWFERADGGTLFLDEIGELPLAAQVRLLRVVQDGVFERVGGARPLEVDVRIVAATHRDLGAMVAAGTFREDLWYRINVFVIRLPPLRERQGDIAALAEHFTERAAQRFGAVGLRVTPDDIALLQQYDWPGNVRELAAVIERAAILGEGRRLDVQRALGLRSDGGLASERMRVGTSDRFPTLDEAMAAHIERALERCAGRIDGPRGAAKLLDIHPNTLRSRMQKLGVRLPGRGS
ncbi:MAG TPA: sigma-54 dependent transcriptional regulator [Kofleriaceae bacterium]|nr:sigma-54 dependent transcriptional regulator [Kofleriaceae bacterium]